MYTSKWMLDLRGWGSTPRCTGRTKGTLSRGLCISKKNSFYFSDGQCVGGKRPYKTKYWRTNCRVFKKRQVENFKKITKQKILFVRKMCNKYSVLIFLLLQYASTDCLAVKSNLFESNNILLSLSPLPPPFSNFSSKTSPPPRSLNLTKFSSSQKNYQKHGLPEEMRFG